MYETFDANIPDAIAVRVSVSKESHHSFALNISSPACAIAMHVNMPDAQSTPDATTRVKQVVASVQLTSWTEW
jgi:hypothetical protein